MGHDTKTRFENSSYHGNVSAMPKQTTIVNAIMLFEPIVLHNKENDSRYRFSQRNIIIIKVNYIALVRVLNGEFCKDHLTLPKFNLD